MRTRFRTQMRLTATAMKFLVNTGDQIVEVRTMDGKWATGKLYTERHRELSFVFVPLHGHGAKDGTAIVLSTTDVTKYDTANRMLLVPGGVL